MPGATSPIIKSGMIKLRKLLKIELKIISIFAITTPPEKRLNISPSTIPIIIAVIILISNFA